MWLSLSDFGNNAPLFFFHCLLRLFCLMGPFKLSEVLWPLRESVSSLFFFVSLCFLQNQ